MSVKNISRTLIFSLAVALCAAIATPSLLAQAKDPGTVILKGAPLGGVKFDHKKHAAAIGADKCTTCHHPSKPEKAATSPTQKCSECHTKTAAAPMKTKYQAAFHDPMAKKGVCIDCHVAEVGKGKKAPTKCNECHKKENV
jgi:formate-dependent nitrite reductase cytochrome c552 subunit